MSATSSEFRQRGGHQRSGSSNDNLPRPGATPRASPINARRTYSGGAPPPAPPAYAARSSSYSSMTSVGSMGNMGNRRPSYSNTSSAFNPSSSSPQFSTGGGGYGGSAGYSSNGYGNGYANGLSSGSSSDDKYAKKSKRKTSSGPPNGLGMVIGGILLFVYAVIMTTLYFSKNSATKRMLFRLDQPDTISVVNKFEELQRKLRDAERQTRQAEQTARNKMTAEINRLERAHKLAQSEADEAIQVHLPEAREHIQKQGMRELAFADQVGWLMDRTRRESKRMVLERFGPGPHKVEITYAVSMNVHDEQAERKRYKFVIEMAPLDLVPHAIHLFLEQVDHGLLEGTHFYLNGPHIVQAGPQPDWNEIDGTDDVFVQQVSEADKGVKLSGNAVNTLNKYEKQAAMKKTAYDDDAYEPYYTYEEMYEEDKRTKKFQDLGLDQLAFPDYHPDFPHTPWTVGYTGRPGGPDWYINKVDNTKGHGPGGQTQHALNEQGDSCFGTISIEGDGRNALASTVYQGDIYADNSEWHHFITNPIEIVSATILTKDPILDRHLHLDHLHSQHKVYDFRRRRDDSEQLPEHRQPKKQNIQESVIEKKAHNNAQRPRIPGAAEA